MVSPLALTRLDPSAADRLLAAAEDAPFTYAEVGGTRGPTPAGYHALAQEVGLGRGGDVFERAREGVRAWKAHAGAGLTVYPANAPIAVGTAVLATTRIGPIWTRAMCRIVYVIDNESTFGFAYGTVDPHPAQGEEAFVVERHPSGEVVFRVYAFSRPSHPLVRLSGPIGRRLQRRAAARYLDALRAFVTGR